MTTPTPFLYRHLLATLVFVFVFTFPFGFIDLLGIVVVPASIMMCFGLYGVLQLAQELENPLGWDDNDIDLSGFQVRSEIKHACGVTHPWLNAKFGA